MAEIQISSHDSSAYAKLLCEPAACSSISQHWEALQSKHTHQKQQNRTGHISMPAEEHCPFLHTQIPSNGQAGNNSKDSLCTHAHGTLAQMSCCIHSRGGVHTRVTNFWQQIAGLAWQTESVGTQPGCLLILLQNFLPWVAWGKGCMSAPSQGPFCSSSSFHYVFHGWL